MFTIIKVEKEGRRGELVTKESQFKFTSSKGPGVPELVELSPGSPMYPGRGLMPAFCTGAHSFLPEPLSTLPSATPSRSRRGC